MKGDTKRKENMMAKMMGNKTGQFNNLSAAAVGVMIFVIVLGIGATVLSQLESISGATGCSAHGMVWNSTREICCAASDSTNCTTRTDTATNASKLGLQGLVTFSNFTSVVVVIVVAAVIIGLIAVAFRAFA